MAKVRTPLLSFGASGKLANTLVFFSWKGIDVAREYVIPTNPSTADQVTQRTLFTGMVSAWRNYFTDATARAAWDRAASAGKNPQSGFNAFMSAALQIVASDPDASFVYSASSPSADIVSFVMKNADDGTTGDETGDFEIWYGTSATSLLTDDSSSIVAGGLDTSALGSTGDVVYVKLRKDGQDRSGIFKLTLVG